MQGNDEIIQIPIPWHAGKMIEELQDENARLRDEIKRLKNTSKGPGNGPITTGTGVTIKSNDYQISYKVTR